MINGGIKVGEIWEDDLKDLFGCRMGIHSWVENEEKKFCKNCNTNYIPKKCRLGKFSKHTWITTKSRKRCKFCWKSYEEWHHEFWHEGGDMGG